MSSRSLKGKRGAGPVEDSKESAALSMLVRLLLKSFFTKDSPAPLAVDRSDCTVVESVHLALNFSPIRRLASVVSLPKRLTNRLTTSL